MSKEMEITELLTRAIRNPLSALDRHQSIEHVLTHLASQENCDGEPYDQMTDAAQYIKDLKEFITNNIINE